MRAFLIVFTLFCVTACRDASGTAPLAMPPFTLRGAAFSLVAVDGKALPTAATFPISTDSVRILARYMVRGGTLHFEQTSDTALMYIGPLDALAAGDPAASFAGMHRVAYVGSDSLMFDPFLIGPISFGPTAVARFRGDTLRLATIPRVASAPAGFLGYLPPPEPPFYGEHLWLFVRSRP